MRGAPQLGSRPPCGRLSREDPWSRVFFYQHAEFVKARPSTIERPEDPADLTAKSAWISGGIKEDLLCA